jgi:ribosomal protein L37AE/L43A
MSNNLKSVTVNIEEDYKNSPPKCNNCKAQGIHEIYKREQITHHMTEDLIYSKTVKNVSYYLCESCFKDLWQEKCPDCESTNTRRDSDDLELICLDCGYVIGSYVPEPKPKPITRYGTYNKPEYDLYFNQVCDLTTYNYPTSWISYISVDDFIIIFNTHKYFIL